MITGFWGSTKVFCDEHKEEMTLVMHSGTPCYECPVCHQNISCYEFEKMINHFQKVITDGMRNFEEINITHFTWNSKAAKYTVLSHSSDKTEVSVKVNG